MGGDSELSCSVCDETVSRADAIVCGTMGDLDPDSWQTLCCPTCGNRLKTVFVGSDT